MSLYVYEKALPPQEHTPLPLPPSIKPLHFLPLTISFLGMILIGLVVWPILSYELAFEKSTTHTASGLLNPFVQASENGNYAAAPSVVNQLDFTQASNWFPAAALNLTSSPTVPVSYTISIPKLKITDAIVSANNMDLSKSLIHYPDTALPGQLGSPVIFGHSILPQFYNPKNYMAIFSLLPNLEVGDKIFISFDNVKYTYSVDQKKEVYPTDLSPLEQRYDQKTLKLITCVPPGLKTRRLVVTAVLSRS